MSKPSDATTITVPTGLGPLAVRRLGSGPPAVLWHSLFVDGHSWDAVLPALAATHHVYVIDGPCHGASPGPGRRFTLDECAGAALAVLDHLSLDQVDWIGNAWGGHVGVVLALRSPARVRSLAAICSPMQAMQPPARRKATLLARLLRVLGWRGFIRGAVKGVLLHPPVRPEVAAYVDTAMRAPGKTRMLHAIHSVMIERTSLVEQLPRVVVPTLFATTRASTNWTVAAATEQAARLADGRLEILGGGGHLPPLEDPTATAALLTRWLARGA